MPRYMPHVPGYYDSALNMLTEAELGKVHGLFISLDPARDSYADIKMYTDYFHSKLIGITGSEQEVASRYGVKYYQVELKDSAFGYAVNHSSVIYLITPEGALRFAFPHNTPASVLLEATRYVLSGQ